MEFGRAYADELPDSHRRALLEAARELIDTTIDDLASSDDPEWSADNWLVGTMLPSRYKLKYDGAFARRFLACLMTVIWKLGQPAVIHPSCVAEELAADVLIREAEAILDQQSVKAHFDDLYDAFFEDLDFEYLYDDAYDGIEKADIAETMGITNLAFADWFKRFGRPDTFSYTEVHPYAQDDGGTVTTDDDSSPSDANTDANIDDMR
ncbi:MAG TPA: hypothetical protein VGP82_07975 [Ktedonobacterales bacterium]|jgi:hypothetical protein|nr:hypothetical protein [Ktedonobacterales bacterium]